MAGVIILKTKLTALLLALCACTAKPRPEALPCPPFPPLPRIAAVELQSLSADAYRRLVERELRLREYIGALKTHCHD